VRYIAYGGIDTSFGGGKMILANLPGAGLAAVSLDSGNIVVSEVLMRADHGTHPLPRIATFVSVIAVAVLDTMRLQRTEGGDLALPNLLPRCLAKWLSVRIIGVASTRYQRLL
jgi:hypothetical protein